ncbi:HtaA domain-containing protein [Streptomyces lunalinharesii]|uniref:HtaA domain-containing protein n=1 Tax=Streptomyces lunalinharesii TaxID=333384 RepID=A0ABP6F6Q1_9ACTN
MPPSTRSTRFPRPALAGPVLLLPVVLLLALLPATTAHAATRTVQGGRLDWGVKTSFQSYVTGPVAHGSYTLAGGATTVGASQFRFPSARGDYDAATGTFDASFAGAVRFLGHRRADGTHQLDLTLSHPTVRISGDRGTLYLDVSSRAKDGGTVDATRHVPFATLALGGIDMHGDGDAVTLRQLPTTLTAQGAAAFAGYYPAGTALDPVSLSADIERGRTGPPSPAAARRAAPEPGRTTGQFSDGAVDWGVRRTFREYVTGTLTRGRWQLTHGARDGGALFRFADGRGTFDAQRQRLTSEFTGTVRFTGGHGLDLALSAPSVTVEAGEGTLRADVSHGARTTRNVPLVTFAAERLGARGGLVRLSEVPTTLTAQGAEAFGGLYARGTAMDPLSLAIALDPSAELPALPDPGSEPKAAATTRSADAAGATDAVAETAGAGSPTGLVVAMVAATVALLAGVALHRGRARRRASSPAPDDRT